MKSLLISALAAVAIIPTACTGIDAANEVRYEYPDIFDISYTPDTLHRCTGWFTDAGDGSDSRFLRKRPK